MSRRDQIKMSDEEVAGFLAGERVVTCATNGRGRTTRCETTCATSRANAALPPAAAARRRAPRRACMDRPQDASGGWSVSRFAWAQ